MPPHVLRFVRALEKNSAAPLDAVFALFNADGDGVVAKDDLCMVCHADQEHFFTQLGITSGSVGQALREFNDRGGGMDCNTFIGLMSTTPR